MAIHLALRNGTAAQWASTNPVLSQGEIGCTNDTYIFKIGDGSTAWNSLAIAPTGSPTQTIPWKSLGDGSDGQLTVTTNNMTSGPLTSGLLTRDAYFTNLIISGSGAINTNGYRLFVNGVLDLSAAGVGAINFNGANGGNASGSTGGSLGAAISSGSIGGSVAGAAGATGTTSTGTAGGSPGNGGNGGNSNITGLGGTGSSGAGGAATAGSGINQILFLRRFETNLIKAATVVLGGSGGRGGSSGAGDGSNAGAGGGGGGAGGGVIAIYANVILKSSSSVAGTIQANGGTGGNGANATTGVTGGGSGGSGGGGGWIYVAYNYNIGPAIIILCVNGGNGGNGGNGVGSISTVISGGGGSSGGYGGRITIFNIVTQTGNEEYGYTTNNENPEVITGSAALYAIGGMGSTGGLRSHTF